MAMQGNKKEPAHHNGRPYLLKQTLFTNTTTLLQMPKISLQSLATRLHTIIKNHKIQITFVGINTLIPQADSELPNQFQQKGTFPDKLLLLRPNENL